MSEHQIEKFGLWTKKSTKGDELTKDVTRTNDHLRKLSLPRVEKEKRLMRLYAADPSGYTAELTAYLRRDRPEFNMIRQGVDTQVAQVVARQKYLPRYLVVDGSWSMGRTSRIRTRVMEGQTEDLNVAAELSMAALDGYILSSPGWLVGYLDENGDPAIDRVHPGEVLIDPQASVSGKSKLKRGHRRRSIPLEWLLEQYPKLAALIESSARATDRDREYMFLPKDNTCDDVRVDEVWSAGTKDKPGRHVICTNKVALVDEPWPYDVPLIPVYYLKRQTGSIGMGLAELGQDEQIRLDRTLKCANAGDKIDSTIYVMAGTNQRFFAESVPGDETVRIFRTNAPQGTEFKAFRGTSAPLHAEAERIRERFLSLTGINQLDAEGKKPAGIVSEPGQRTFADLAARRQQQVSDNIKDAWKGVFEMLEQLNAYAQSKDKDFSIAARTTRGLVPLVNTVKWSDAAMESEQYRLSLQLVSDVPYQAGSRVEAVQEWIRSGFTRRTFGQAQTMQGPNEDYQRRETADTDYACWMVERVLDGDFSVELDPYLIPEVAFDVFRTSYLPIKSDGAPEDVLMKLRQLIDDSLDAIGKKTMPGPVAPDGMYTPPEALQLQDMPQGGGAAPPTAPPMPAGPEMPMPMA
jgi:hypothetical protein